MSTFSASLNPFCTGAGIVHRSVNPSTRFMADKIKRSEFSFPILGSNVVIILLLKLPRACTKAGFKNWFAPNFFWLDSNTPKTILSKPGSSGTVLSVASPRPRLTTDMAMASASGVRCFNCSVTVAMKLVMCLTSSGATAGLRGGELPLTAGCAGRAPVGGAACADGRPARGKPFAGVAK